MNFLQLQRETLGIEPEFVFDVFGFPISNSTLMIILITLALLFFSLKYIRKFKLKPGNLQSVTEMLYEGIVDLVNQITGDRKISEKILPIIGSLLIYIGIANLVTLLVPGLTSITYNGVALFRTATSDFNTTFGLALGAVILTQAVSIKDWGAWGHLNKYIQIENLFKTLIKKPKQIGIALVEFFVGLLDIVGEIAKVISLSLRLFGNMYAGEVLMMVIFGGLAYLLPSLWVAMSLLVGVVQALVFSLLVAAYYMLAIKPKEAENK